jgi:hypothetical protein
MTCSQLRKLQGGCIGVQHFELLLWARIGGCLDCKLSYIDLRVQNMRSYTQPVKSSLCSYDGKARKICSFPSMVKANRCQKCKYL